MGSVGKPLPGVHVSIDRSAPDDPVGEILVSGPNVMRGYHDRPEDDAQVFTDSGALRTGDMGYVDEDGFLFITGRIKEQYKLETGKYIVPSPLEEELKLSPFVANVLLYGDNRPHNVALVVPAAEELENWARQQSVSLGEVTTDSRVLDLIRAEIDARSATFRSYERPRAIALVADDFTVENGLLTPSLKLKRREVIAKYQSVLDGLY
jgi:long-chain acyl-CoA synthetase